MGLLYTCQLLARISCIRCQLGRLDICINLEHPVRIFSSIFYSFISETKSIKMSRSAGTLQTTHQATYIPPRLMPGYKGHCPTMKFDYGETYANATAKYFQDYRSATLDNSKTNYSNGGQFPTVYTHNPDQVIGARDRTRERWRTEPKYSLSNVNHDRKEEVNRFDKLAQEHREHYKDRTGTVPRVNEFLIPRTAEQMYHQDSAL